MASRKEQEVNPEVYKEIKESLPNFERVIEPNFHALVRKFEIAYDIDFLCRRADIIEGSSHQDFVSSDEVLTLVQKDIKVPKFTFYYEDYKLLTEQVERSFPIDRQKIEDGVFSLYVGGGLGRYMLKRTIFNPDEERSPEQLQEITEVFTTHTPTEELFTELCEDGLCDPRAFISRHMKDSNIQLINGWRMALYFYRRADDPENVRTEVVAERAKASLRLAMKNLLPEYENLGNAILPEDDELGALAISQEVEKRELTKEEKCELTYVTQIPEWLIALAKPMYKEEFKHLLSDGWKH